MLIVVNVLVFLYELTLSAAIGLNHFIAIYGIVPDRLHWSSIADFHVHPRRMAAHPGQHVVPVDFRPRRRRHSGARPSILFFYLACGVAAGLIHDAGELLNSPVPTVGASGAIAGVMGAYLIKFPRARIVTLVFIFFFITTVDIPACVSAALLVRHSILQRCRLGGLFASLAAATWPGSRTSADSWPAWA